MGFDSGMDGAGPGAEGVGSGLGEGGLPPQALPAKQARRANARQRDGKLHTIRILAASQQVKAFDNNGNSLWVYGLAGGYPVNGAAVTTNKFWFFDGEHNGTFICFASDDTYWVGDGGNHRTMHFSLTGNYIEQIMYQPHSYTASVDQNNPGRVFNEFLEFQVDYNKPLSQAWTLVRNWEANVDSNHIS